MPGRTGQLLSVRLQELLANQAARTAGMTFALLKAGLDLIMSHERT